MATAAAASAHPLLASSMAVAKVNKVIVDNAQSSSSSSSRKANSLRLSLRRFSHGANVVQRKISKTEASNTDFSANSALDLDVYPWLRCQQLILRLVQGQKVDVEERVKVSISIRNLLLGSKNLAVVLLSELFSDSALPAALRQFAAATLGKRSTDSSIVGGLWLRFYSTILPDVHALLYPFEESTFSDIRKLVLTAYRDHVVLDHDLCYGLLKDGRISETSSFAIQRMLLILEQSTRDGSPEYSKLLTLCERLTDDFSSSETFGLCLPSPHISTSPVFFIEEHERSDSPKVLQRFLRRAKDSFSALASSSEQSDAGYLDVKPSHGRSRSPLTRVRNAFLSECGGGNGDAGHPRRHGYAPAST